MTNLRNGIDYLKQQCEQNSGSQGMLNNCNYLFFTRNYFKYEVNFLQAINLKV